MSVIEGLLTVTNEKFCIILIYYCITGGTTWNQ